MIVRSRADLAVLIAAPSLRRLRREGVVLDLAGFTAEELHNAQKRLDRHLHDCGCSMGSIFSLAAAVATAVLAITVARLGILGTIAVTFAALILFGVAGKLSGLALAAYRFRRLCHSIARRVSA